MTGPAAHEVSQCGPIAPTPAAWAVGDVFFGGGRTGALGFKHIGYTATVPLAAGLALLAVGPILTDVRVRWKAYRRRRIRKIPAASAAVAWDRQ